MRTKYLFSDGMPLAVLRGCSVCFAAFVCVLSFSASFRPNLPASDFASREADVRTAIAMHFRRISGADVIRSFDFAKLPQRPELIDFPALFLNNVGERCLAIGTLSAAAESEDNDPSIIRCIDGKGSVIRRSWKELTSEAVGILSVKQDGPIAAPVGEGSVQFNWLLQDFGASDSNGPYSADFQLSNVGNVPIVIKQVTQSCTCIEEKHRHDLPLTVAVGEVVDFTFVIQYVVEPELSLQATMELDCNGVSSAIPLRIFAARVFD